jgi:hypothetical protein
MLNLIGLCGSSRVFVSNGACSSPPECSISMHKSSPAGRWRLDRIVAHESGVVRRRVGALVRKLASFGATESLVW